MTRWASGTGNAAWFYVLLFKRGTGVTSFCHSQELQAEGQVLQRSAVTTVVTTVACDQLLLLLHYFGLLTLFSLPCIGITLRSAVESLCSSSECNPSWHTLALATYSTSTLPAHSFCSNLQLRLCIYYLCIWSYVVFPAPRITACFSCSTAAALGGGPNNLLLLGPATAPPV